MKKIILGLIVYSMTHYTFAQSCKNYVNSDVFHINNSDAIKKYFLCTPVVYFGDYGGRLISESGKIDRDITLLNMRKRAGFYPWVIVGGDTVFRVRDPKLPGKPFYILNEMSAELQNLRFNMVNNLGPWAYTEFNYQINTDSILDAYITLGNLDYSPFFTTIGQQYIPFGNFNKYDVDANPLNKSIFRVNQQAITLTSLNDKNTLRIFFVKDNSYNMNGVGAAYKIHMNYRRVKLEYGVGILSNINNMTNALQTLNTPRYFKLPVFDAFAIWHIGRYDFRAEWTQLLKSTYYTGHLASYDLEAQYGFHFWKKKMKFVLAFSGMLNQDHLVQNTNFTNLGLFKRQYVFSIKRNIKPHFNVGLSAIFGNELNNKFRHQFALNIVYKV